MKPPAILASLFAVSALLVSVSPAAAQVDFDTQGLADQIVALQSAIDQQQMSAAMNGETIPDKFDANRYFTVLDKLQLEPGFVLDWVYANRGIGGYPVLYARSGDAAPFGDYTAYAGFPANAREPSSVTAEDWARLRYGYLEKIRAEDSPEGFFQLVVLRLLGDRFLLNWHEYYNEIALVGSQPGWQAVLRREQQRGEPYTPPPPGFIAAAEKLDFAPSVTMNDTQVAVAVTTYCPFRGLERCYFEIARPFPHRILTQSKTNLLKHSQRFLF